MDEVAAAKLEVAAVTEEGEPPEPELETGTAQELEQATMPLAHEPEAEDVETLCAQLREGTSAEREAVYVRLLELEDAVVSGAGDPSDNQRAAAVAVACVAPLCEVLCRDAAEIGVVEFRRVTLVLCAIAGIDPASVGGEGNRPGQCNVWSAWSAEASVLGAMLAKDPADLTLEDALTSGCAHAMVIATWATYRAIDAQLDCARIGAMDFIQSFNNSAYLCTVRCPDDERNLALAPLMLELLKEPEKLPQFALVGCIWQLACLPAGRPKVALKLLEHDAVSVYMSVLRRVPPKEQISTFGFSRGGHGEVYHAMRDLLEPAQIGGADLTKTLLHCGFIDQLVAALSVVEKVGAENSNGDVVFFMLWLLKLLDGEALGEIEEKLRAAKPALRFLTDAPITSLIEFGWTSSAFTKLIAANLFGKDEGNAFNFVQTDVDDIVENETEMLRPTSWGKIWQLSLNQCRGLLNLCISDAAKPLLLNNTAFLQLLILGLMLDGDHPRQDTADEIKTRIQRDYAECIQQLSLFPPALSILRADARIIKALDVLVDTALSEGAKDCARGALIQLCPERTKHLAPRSSTDSRAKHIMISYQWDSQKTIARIVAELQAREYLVWFDLVSMKGSIMDAMSDAVEGSDLILYGVSEKYKESANCRLELSYAMQEKVDLVPLMMEEGYKAKGWLGLILGQSLWHAFYDAKVETEAMFMNQMDALVREIGQRGKAAANHREHHQQQPSDPSSTAVLAASEPAPAPAPAPDPSAAAPMPQHHHQPQEASLATAATQHLLHELTTFMERQQGLLLEQHKLMLERDDQQRQELARALEQQRVALTPAPSAEAITDASLRALQGRVSALHEAQLLTEDETVAIEDLVADYIDARMATQDHIITRAMLGTREMVSSSSVAGIPGFGAARRLQLLIGLSEAMDADVAFARQARRKAL